MDWTFVFLMLALKIPLAMLIGIVWWAIKQVPDPATESSNDDGGSKVRHPRPPFPRWPRRGPHRESAPSAPPRVRKVVARARTLEH
jgi:hypothetical protein